MGKCCSSSNNNNKHHSDDKNHIQGGEDQVILTANKVETKTHQKASGGQQPNQGTISKPGLSLPKILKIRFYYEGVALDLEPLEILETETLSTALEPVKTNLPSLSSYTYSTKDNSPINVNAPLKQFFSNAEEVNIINVIYQGLNIPTSKDLIIKAYQNCTLLGNPVPDSSPFELRIFCSENMILTTATFNIEEYQELNTFSHFSAYCNGNNNIYISGGETEIVKEDGTTENIYLNWVVKINLSDGKLTKLEPMHTPRIWHSMIYIPNKYVFIVGGNKTTSVEVINTETGEISEDSNLNEFHSEPSLCLVNSNWLYCFLGFKNDESQEFSKTIERCNLRLSKRTWESFNLNVQINIRFFTLSYYDDSSILILGGDDISAKEIQNDNQLRESQKKAYLFDYTTDTFSELDYGNENFRDFSKDVFPEKFFIPMRTHTNEQISVLIPMQNHQKLKVYLINADKHIEVKEFEDNEVSEYINQN